MKLKHEELKQWSMATVPRETPFGIMDQAVIQLEYCGRKYQIIQESCLYPTSGPLTAMDMESGEIITIDT